MIDVRCTTSRDNCDCSQVNKMVAIPNIGDGVGVIYNGEFRIFKVYSITHLMKETKNGIIPYIEVELVK